jgi:DNA-directed RNA polymerase subunit RPC12/RpoP
MNCTICSRIVEEARVEYGLKICYSCASRTVTKMRGDMNYAHKTAPTLMVMSQDTFKDYRRYVPYGRYTGRGSGVHAMSRPVAKLG